MNGRRLSVLVAASSLAWLLLGAPVSAHAEHAALPDLYRWHSSGFDLQAARHDDGHVRMNAENRDFSRGLANYQSRELEEEKLAHLDREGEDSRERSDDTDRYYWWWPFRR